MLFIKKFILIASVSIFFNLTGKITDAKSFKTRDGRATFAPVQNPLDMEGWPITPDENSETGLVEYRNKKKHAKYIGPGKYRRKDSSKSWNLDILRKAFQPNNEANATKRHVNGINLSFHNLSYSVKQGLRRETKEILRGLYGELRAGELTAIMGPSGSGKTSLMNALAGYTTAGITGSVQVNGVKRDLRLFCRQSCYILQDDFLHPMLTVEESMRIAARLKLGPKTPHLEKRVNVILESLGLSRWRRVMSGKLSGGQRKRLAMALELVNDPPLMFFDEPTSGLDSSTSKQCLGLLKEMAQSGRTIVCTIHQPSASLFELFDHVYVVCGGQCIYSGAASMLVSYLAKQELPCPHYHNPADFLLEVASLEEYGSFIPKLVDATENGKDLNWRSSPVASPDVIIKEILAQNEDICQENLNTNFFDCKKINEPTYAAPFWTQLSTIISRNFRQLYRDQFFTHLRLLIHTGVGLLIGTMFYDVGNNADLVHENFGLLFFSIMFTMFTSYSAAAMYYPMEMPTLMREHFNKWYSLKSYYLAANIADAPIQLLCTSLYFTLVYYMTSQPFEILRFFISLATMLLVALVGQSFGYLIGSCMHVTNAAVFGPLVTSPFILFSGFFVLVTDAHVSLRWLFHVSYFKYALHATMQSIFGFDRERLFCDIQYCHFRAPAKFLKEVGMSDGDIQFDWSILLGIVLILRVLTYYSLTVRVRYARK